MIVPVKTYRALKLLFYWIFTKDKNIAFKLQRILVNGLFSQCKRTQEVIEHQFTNIRLLIGFVLAFWGENINKTPEFAKISGKFSKHSIQPLSPMFSVLVSTT